MVGDIACGRADEGCDCALHVRRAAAVHDAIADLGAERIDGPAGRVANRNDIRMASETEIRRRPAQPGIEVVDALERVALGTEPKGFQRLRQHVLRPVMTGVHCRLADERLGEGDGVEQGIDHEGGFSPPR